MANLISGLFQDAGDAAKASTVLFAEPYRKNNCLLCLPTFDLDHALTFRVESFDLPKFSVQTRERGYLNTNRRYVSTHTREPMSLVIRDTFFASGAGGEDPSAPVHPTKEALQFLYGWFAMVYNEKYGIGTLGPTLTGITGPEDYRSTGTVYWFSPDGTMRRMVNLHGVWPTEIDPGEMNMEEEGPQTIKATFNVDLAIPVGDFDKALVTQITV